MLLWAFVLKYLCGHLFLGGLPVGESLGHTTTVCFTFWEQSDRLAKWLFYIPTSSVSMSPCLRQHLVASSVLLSRAILVDVKRCLVAWCAFPLMTNDVEHLCMCSLPICVSSRNIYSNPLSILKIGLSFDCWVISLFWIQISYQIHK